MLMGAKSPLFFLFMVLCSLQLVDAQPLHPEVHLTHPNKHAANALDTLQAPGSPAVGVYYSGVPADTIRSTDAVLAESVLHWEYLLVGVQLPYTLLTDSTFNEAVVESLDILIVPEVDLLSDSSMTVLHQFVEKGGGVIASGMHAGARAEGCNASAMLADLIGASHITEVDEASSRIAQSLVGDSRLLQGIPSAFELDILPVSMCTARAGSGSGVGYQAAGTSEKATLMLSHEVGEGRVVWTGFGPQDIPPDELHQRMYQGFILNAMAYATNAASVAIRRWPAGNRSATALMQLPSSGYQPFSYRTSTDLLLSALDNASTSATFFLVSRHAQDHPDLISRMKNQGEIALVADTQKPLAGLRPELQQERLAAGKSSIESLSRTTIRGILPPSYFYDPNTLHALLNLEMEYMLSGAGTLLEPGFMPWAIELDYRDSLLAVSPSAIPSRPEPLVRLYPVLYSYDLDKPVAEEPASISALALQKRWMYRLNRTFEEVHQAGGLFIFAYEPESMGLTQERASLLNAFGNRLKTTNTWSATLGEIVDWWRLRDRITVEIERFSTHELALVVTNKNSQPVQGVTLSGVFPGFDMESARLKSGDVDITWDTTEKELILQLGKLPPGSQEIHWELERNTSDEMVVP